MKYRRLNLPGEDRLLGAGVYYEAGASEACLCRSSDDVYVAGGGQLRRAGRHAFPRASRSVTMVVRGESIHSSMSRYLLDRNDAAPNVRVLSRSNRSEVCGRRTWQRRRMSSR
jgi:thioredoxin reductase (NADPH)